MRPIEARLRPCSWGLVILLVVGGSGCIFAESASDRDLPATGADGDAEPVDAGDARGNDTPDAADGGDATDGGDVTDGGDTGRRCNFRGNQKGVCSAGVPVTSAGDAGDLVSGDGGSGCRAPESYRAEEAPPEDEEPPYEVCDGLDNDCDGIVDEGCPCDFNNLSTGICKHGTLSEMEQGRCDGPKHFQTDETRCDGKDNDCDGVVDEGCPCIYPSPNGTEGVCQQGRKSAESGACERPGDYVAEEGSDHCDSKDNDCDGEVDENCECEQGVTESCYTGPSGTAGTGVCEAGSRSCGSNGWGACDDETTPSKETCDGKDNDCDGVVDEGCSCNYDNTSTGVCSEGQIGSQGNCKEPNNYEQDESRCDGEDNDCDGAVDENCPCDYNSSSEGVCGTATRDASGVCQKPADYEQTETLCDSKDNDCDGETDDAEPDLSCSCTSGETTSCYTGKSGTEGVGICSSGSKTCRDDGSWGACTDQTTPSTETCDGKDNNCDGVVDEGCTCDYQETSSGVCKSQTRDSSGTCPKPNHYESSESSCGDGLDNDCDGQTDCADSACAGESCGPNQGAGATCVDGTCTEQDCADGIDNDGDGRTDCADPDCGGEACGKGGGGAVCHDQTCVETNCSDNTNNDEDGGADESDAADCLKTASESCLTASQCVSGHCSGGTCAQTIVVTSTTHGGDFGGASGATSACQQAAGGRLGGTWKAVVSGDNLSASSRVSVSGKVYNYAGQKVADGSQDLWGGSIDHAVIYDENGTDHSQSGGTEQVWTGTNSGGALAHCGINSAQCHCGNWQESTTGVGATGNLSNTGAGWVDNGSRNCASSYRVYCIDGQ